MMESDIQSEEIIMRRTEKGKQVALAYKIAPWKWTGRPKNDLSIFWSRVEKKGSKECWNWLGSTNSIGYGSFRFGGPKMTAHRIAYWDSNRRISKLAPSNKNLKAFVLHRCDNRLCCNPKHLFIGNYKDNIQDAIKKGRSKYAHGEKHPAAKLSNAQALEIRKYLISGRTRKEMQHIYAVSERIIARIANNNGYKEA